MFCETFRWTLLVCVIVIYVRVQNPIGNGNGNGNRNGNGNGSAYDSEQTRRVAQVCDEATKCAYFTSQLEEKSKNCSESY